MIGPIRLVVVAEAVRRAAAAGPAQPVFGTIRAAERLIQVLTATPDESGSMYPVGIVNPTTGEPGFQLTLDLLQQPLVFEFLGHEPLVEKVESVEIMEVATALESRRAGLVPERGLREKVVLLAGAGSVGSMVGLLLAQAGVGRIIVLDHDRLDAANLSRHACDRADLGRAKAIAVAALLDRRFCAATPVEQDILALGDAELDALVGQSHLVVASTDSAAAQFTVNEACVRTGIAGLFVGAYERATGGEVVIVRPKLGPCLFCCVGFRAEVPAGVTVKERRQAYQAADAIGLEAEPGLGADITYLSAVATAHALALLDPTGCRASLLANGRSFVLLHGGSDPRGPYQELFHAAFEVLHARIRLAEPCPVCGWQGGQEAVER